MDGVSAVSGSLRVVLLVAVQLVRVVGGHVGEVLENVLVGFISCKSNKNTRHQQWHKIKNRQTEQWFPYILWQVFIYSSKIQIYNKGGPEPLSPAPKIIEKSARGSEANRLLKTYFYVM